MPNTNRYVCAPLINGGRLPSKFAGFLILSIFFSQLQKMKSVNISFYYHLGLDKKIALNLQDHFDTSLYGIR
jgi:hypothetical protein